MAHVNSLSGQTLPNPRSTILSNGDFKDMEFIANTNVLLALEKTSGLYVSYDGGYNWNHCPVNGAATYYKLTLDSNQAYVGTDIGMYSTSIITSVSTMDHKGFIFYPNPVTDQLMIQIENGRGYNVTIL